MYRSESENDAWTYLIVVFWSRKILQYITFYFFNNFKYKTIKVRQLNKIYNCANNVIK
jgi:hypothetical protein